MLQPISHCSGAIGPMTSGMSSLHARKTTVAGCSAGSSSSVRSSQLPRQSMTFTDPLAQGNVDPVYLNTSSAEESRMRFSSGKGRCSNARRLSLSVTDAAVQLRICEKSG